ncbi:MAG TPA: HAD family hydrolase [Candidatus Dormibacteraeota bacterium]|nr:HAD family hydrolase [Candidatus Dormibacteraeota bacterium]
MKLRALATDYDGTLAWHGTVEPSTCRALEAFKQSGRKLIMVTGRELHDLFGVFSQANMFDLIVAENGALLHFPESRHTTPLSPPPPPEFVERLREEGVRPLSVGHGIVATQEVYRGVIEEVINELMLNWHIILNKGALMVLPIGVDKATGLVAALQALQLSPAEVAGVGDAENDFAFLQLCGCSAAVDNAIPELKNRVKLVTHGSRGAGVEELIAKVMAEDK